MDPFLIEMLVDAIRLLMLFESLKEGYCDESFPKDSRT